jgi:hypothetical protein
MSDSQVRRLLAAGAAVMVVFFVVSVLVVPIFWPFT